MEQKTADNPKPRRFKLKMPHTYILLGMILVFCTVLTYLVPAGQYDRMEDPETGYEVVVNGTYHRVEQSPVSPFSMFVAIQKGMIEASDIIFFIFFAYSFVHIVLKTGALNAGVGTLMRKLKGMVMLIIPIFMVAFGIMGSTIGIYEEVYGLIPVFLGIFMSMGFDAITGGGVVVIGVVTGFAAATTNPFTIGVAQSIAGVPLFSGIGLRIVVFVVFEILVISYVMLYARKVKAHPEKSIVYGMDMSHMVTMDREEMEKLRLTTRQKLVMLLFVATIAVIIVGTLRFGWYINEITATFIIAALVVGLVGGFGFSKIAELMVEGIGSVIYGALVVGLARAILIVMQDGMIIDTVVYSLVGLLQNANAYVSAIGMMLIQNVVNFFIPSGSGQAATTMPIMAPVADLVGLSRQTAVLAYQFGDGFSNLFWPTVIATECGLMGIPVNKWYKFIGKLFLLFLGLQVIFMCIAVAIGYS